MTSHTAALTSARVETLRRVLEHKGFDFEGIHEPDKFQPHFGIDDSGKGDFFGPLITPGPIHRLQVAQGGSLCEIASKYAMRGTGLCHGHALGAGTRCSGNFPMPWKSSISSWYCCSSPEALAR